MTIQFRCEQCSKLLSAPKEAAGKRAKCPACETIMAIPAAEAPVPPPSPKIPSPEVPPPPIPPEADRGAFGPPPIQEGSPFAGTSQGNPQFGQQYAPGAAADRGVPQNPYQAPGEYAPQWSSGAASGEAMQLDLGDVFSRAWAAFSDQWGLCVGTTFLAIVLVVVFYIICLFIGGFFAAVTNSPVLAILSMTVPFLCFAPWLNAGQTLIFLQVARGRPASLDMLFSGGPFLFTFFVATFLFGLGMYLGLLLFIIPGILCVLAFSPAFFLIVDRNLGVMDAFRESFRITKGNLLTLLAIFFLLFAINMLSVLPFMGLFCYPFSAIVLATAYLRMTGQPTAN